MSAVAFALTFIEVNMILVVSYLCLRYSTDRGECQSNLFKAQSVNAYFQITLENPATFISGFRTIILLSKTDISMRIGYFCSTLKDSRLMKCIPD